jgi:hypothetical protein
VDEINHYIHDECRDERDDNNRRMKELRADHGSSGRRGEKMLFDSHELGNDQPTDVFGSSTQVDRPPNRVFEVRSPRIQRLWAGLAGLSNTVHGTRVASILLQEMLVVGPSDPRLPEAGIGPGVDLEPHSDVAVEARAPAVGDAVD